MTVMSDSIEEPLSVLCDEAGIPMPSADERGGYEFIIDYKTLRVSLLNRGAKVVLLGVIGHVESIAEQRRESRERLLTSCLTLQAVRFGRLGTSEVLTLEPETGELVLWVSFENYSLSIPGFIAAAESLLNELDFWKNWLAAT